jgi:hypothetical protein
MKFYGSFPTTLVQHPSALRWSLMSIARLGLALILASALFITLTALSRETNNYEVLQSARLQMLDSQLSVGSDIEEIPVKHYSLAQLWSHCD